MKTYIFKIKFLHAKRIQREIEVLESFSLYQLADAVVEAYGFDFDHAFGFFSKISKNGWDLNQSEKIYELFNDMGEEPTAPHAKGVQKVKVSEVWQKVGDEMMMLFDYGDDWRWIVTLKALGEKDTKQNNPRTLSVKGEAPEQYPDAEDEDDE